MAIIKSDPDNPTASPEAGATILVENDTDQTLIFSSATMWWILGGIALMIVGMLLMAGGAMPSADVWDDELIYSFRRITLAPIVIISGLIVIGYAVLKK